MKKRVLPGHLDNTTERSSSPENHGGGEGGETLHLGSPEAEPHEGPELEETAHFDSLAMHYMCSDNKSSSFHLLSSAILFQGHDFHSGYSCVPLHKSVLKGDIHTLSSPLCCLHCPSSKSCLKFGDHVYSPLLNFEILLMSDSFYSHVLKILSVKIILLYSFFFVSHLVSYRNHFFSAPM